MLVHTIRENLCKHGCECLPRPSEDFSSSSRAAARLVMLPHSHFVMPPHSQLAAQRRLVEVLEATLARGDALQQVGHLYTYVVAPAMRYSSVAGSCVCVRVCVCRRAQ